MRLNQKVSLIIKKNSLKLHPYGQTDCLANALYISMWCGVEVFIHKASIFSSYGRRGSSQYIRLLLNEVPFVLFSLLGKKRSKIKINTVLITHYFSDLIV